MLRFSADGGENQLQRPARPSDNPQQQKPGTNYTVKSVCVQLRGLLALQSLVRSAMKQLQMTPHPEAGVPSCAHTIADLEGAGALQTQHLAEAIQYRPRRER